MAEIFKRFKDIMSANINALLDKAEDPEKMCEQYLRDMESDLGQVKAQTASVMADAEAAKRKLAGTEEEIDKMQRYAEKALKSGKEDDARKFLEKKAELSKERVAEKQALDAAEANAEKMHAMHDKLVKDISSLRERQTTIKAKTAAAKAQKKINDMNEKVGSMDLTDGVSAFDRMEAKADHMLDEENARAQLNSGLQESEDVDDLAAKYDEGGEEDIDAELEEMKRTLGL